MTALCTVPDCNVPTPDSFVCPACARQLEADLADLPALLDDLETTLTRQDRLADAARPPTSYRVAEDYSPERRPLPPHLRSKDAGYALPSTPWPYSQAASHELDDAVNTLSTWVRHIVEARGIRPFAPHVELHRDIRTATATACARWLLLNLASVRQDEAGAQIVDEVGYLARSLRHSVDARDLGTFVARCSNRVRVMLADDVITISPDPCGADLYDYYGSVKCHDCGATYDAETLHLAIGEALVGKRGTATQIAAWLSASGERVTAEQIWRWKNRGQITVRVCLVKGERGPVYSVDEVRLLQETKANGGQLPKRAGVI